jgi:hypothetical protein
MLASLLAKLMHFARIRKDGRSSKEMECRALQHPFSLWRKNGVFLCLPGPDVIPFHCSPQPTGPQADRPLILSLFHWLRGTLTALKPLFLKVPKGGSEPTRKNSKCLQTLCEHNFFSHLGHYNLCPWRFVNGNTYHCLLLK